MIQEVRGGEVFVSVRNKGKTVTVALPLQAKGRRGQRKVVVTTMLSLLVEWSYWIDEAALFDPKKWRPA